MGNVDENEAFLKRKGNFFNPKDRGLVYKCRKGNKYYWQKTETYGEFLKRIINCL